MNKKTFSMMIEFNKFVKDYLKNNPQLNIYTTSVSKMYNTNISNFYKNLLVHKSKDDTLIGDVLKEHFNNENISVSKDGGYLSKNITEFINDDVIAAYFYITTINSNFYWYSAYRNKNLVPESILFLFSQFIQNSSDENKTRYTKTFLSFLPKKTSFYNIYNAFNNDLTVLNTLLTSSFFKDECKSNLPSLIYLLNEENNTGLKAYIQFIIDSDNEFLNSIVLQELNKKEYHQLSYFKSQLTPKISDNINIPSLSLFSPKIEEEIFWENKTIIPFKSLCDEFSKQNININNIFNKMFFRIVENSNNVNHIFHCSLVDKNLIFHTILKSNDKDNITEQLKYIGDLNKFNEFFLGTIIQDFQDKNNRFSCILNQYSTKNLESISITKFQKFNFAITESILKEYREFLLSKTLKENTISSSQRDKKKI